MVGKYSLRGVYKRAVVTGGAGFIGSHLVESLLADGLEVVSIDNYSTGKRSNLEHLSAERRLRIVDCDITDKAAVSPHLAGADVVFHEACSKMTMCLIDPARDLEVNAQGTFNMLEAAREHGVNKFVHASTGSVYGVAQYYPTDEAHPVNPTSYYGVSKLAGEKYVRAFQHLYGMDAVILRYFHVYGPRQEMGDLGGVTCIFGRRAVKNEPLIIFGDGSQVRSFTYVGDVVNINKLVARTSGISGQAFNCASGSRVTIKELADAVLAHYKKQHIGIEYRDWKIGDIKVFDVSNARIKELGMEFTMPFKDGLAMTLDWLAKDIGKYA